MTNVAIINHWGNPSYGINFFIFGEGRNALLFWYLLDVVKRHTTGNAFLTLLF